MYVGLKMLKDFATVSPDTLVKDARKLFEEDQLWVLLVVKDGKLIGYVNRGDTNPALPSVVTSIEKQEIRQVMDKLTIADVAHADMGSVTPETEVEAAADMMNEMNLSGLAVMNENDEPIGYINRSVMLEILVEEMGYREGGSRITIETEDKFGILYEVAGIIANMKYSIISTSTFFHGNRRLIVVRVATEDTTEIEAFLKERGYNLAGPSDFSDAWK
jgi:acetoin utilization protein AcuB